MPFWLTSEFLQLAICTTGVAFAWCCPWSTTVTVSVTALHLALSLYVIVHLMWRLCSKPDREMPGSNAVVNPNHDVSDRSASDSYTSRLFAIQDVVADIYAFLSRSDADCGQLVSGKLRNAVDANAKKLPLRTVYASLAADGMLTRYLATVESHGSVRGYLFRGLRRCDRPFFRNACITLGFARSACTQTALLAAFLANQELERMDAVVKTINCAIQDAKELPRLFDLISKCKANSLYISHKPSWSASATLFVSSVFQEARRLKLRCLYLSLKDASLTNCTAVDELGHRLLRELRNEEHNPSATTLYVSIPRLTNFGCIARLIKLYSNGEKKRPVRIVCSNDVPLVELWPSHTAYLKESPFLYWEVPVEQGIVVMHSAIGSPICYSLGHFARA